MNAISNSYFHDFNFSFQQLILSLKNKNMIINQQENISVNSQLKILIDAYLTKHSGLTLNALAIRCGVPATTMRRLMQKESEKEQKSELAPHCVLSLTSYLFKEKKISTLLKKIDGPIAELLNRCFDQFIFEEETSSHVLDVDLNKIFQDKTSYLIYKLAANQCGTSLTEIKNIFGLLGLNKLNDLIELNLIIPDKKNAEKLHAKEKNFSVDLSLAHQLTHSLVDFYKPEEVDAGLNLFYSLSEGMSEEGIKKIKEVEKEAVKKIYDLMNHKNLQGNIPYFAVVMSDVLGLTPKININKGVLQ